MSKLYPPYLGIDPVTALRKGGAESAVVAETVDLQTQQTVMPQILQAAKMAPEPEVQDFSNQLIGWTEGDSPREGALIFDEAGILWIAVKNDSGRILVPKALLSELEWRLEQVEKIALARLHFQRLMTSEARIAQEEATKQSPYGSLAKS